ncbi:nucleoside monophosphate kinase [bacterium]|nr:nucleoside monophosphate kinase [bacterium]
MDIILFGIQGSGKGTQGKLLKEYYNMSYFETGAQLRKLASEDSDLGHEVKKIIEAGHLVPNEIVMKIVQNFLSKVSEGKSIIFDGIPRNMIQAETFAKLLDDNNRKYKAVILELSKEEALKRLTQRRVCSKCKEVYPASYQKETCEKCGGKLITRTDDNTESIKVRLDAFFTETIPVINMFESKNKLIHINASGTIKEVDKNLKEILSPILKQQ